jgi:formylglycine-generating enzyme
MKRFVAPKSELPRHQVTVPSFEMMRAEATAGQYAACVAAGMCDTPAPGPYCNYGLAGRADHPVNCIEWDKAEAFCAWAGGRLPSEAEWEYAARNGGADVSHPWGDDAATCEKAIMNEVGVYGCGADSTLPVCSRPLGDTVDGLCDMLGNVWEWTADCYHADYTGAPSDGSAWCGSVPPSDHMRRGGSFDYLARDLHVYRRNSVINVARYVNLGVRCAR